MIPNVSPGYKARTPIQASSQPRVVEKETQALYVLVRDDVAETGFLWIAPVGQMTSMVPVTPEAFDERFEWYVSPQNKEFAEQMAGGPTGPVEPFEGNVDSDIEVEASVATPKNKGGRPKGSKDKRPRKRPVRKAIPAAE